jgi:hypothetical protein
MWEPQPLTTLRASKACRGENFTFFTNTANDSVAISIMNVRTMAFQGKDATLNVILTTEIDDQVNSFICLAYHFTNENEKVITEKKMPN